MERAAACSVGGIDSSTGGGCDDFLAQLYESYEQLNMEELLNGYAGFAQPFAAGDGDIGGVGILTQAAFDPTDGDSAGLQPPVPFPAGDIGGMGIFHEPVPFSTVDDYDNAGILQPWFGPVDADDDAGLRGQLGDSTGLLQPVSYPAGDAGPASTAAVTEFPRCGFGSLPDDAGVLGGAGATAADMEIAQQGFSLADDMAGLLALGTPRLEEDAHQLTFAGLNSDQACLSMLRAFRRAWHEEKQLDQRPDGQASLAEMDDPGPSDPVRRRAHGSSRARRPRAQHVGAPRGETYPPSRSVAGRRSGSRMPGQ
ncbi:hypothetical protein GQ55_3G449600 [Panicum hallii var. hallii]|uniref:Uncharacterized protein n=1 Tax=Panicum hallii var. hallii TaxID=1504633 RepID=A0A2T7EIE9_9POAL|nr:hypothetical protein GQ55_3G449600 [Panicum hallii var. hallii]